MFPVYDFTNEDTVTVAPAAMGKVFLFDFDKKEHVIRDGKPVEATYEQAIRQWLTMLLITESNKFQVYKGTYFGLSLREFIGRRDVPFGFILSEVKRQLEEKAIMHPEIEAVVNFDISRLDNVAKISFNVETSRGTVNGIEREVIYNG